MKTGKMLSELAVEVQRQARAIQDYRSNTANLVMSDVESDLVIGGHGQFQVNDLAHTQIAGRLNIPQKYYDLMRVQAPALLADNVNHWFHKSSEKRLVRTLDNKVRAFLSSSYRTLDNFRLIETVLPKLQKMEAKIESSEITEKHLYIKAIFHDIGGSVEVGDVVKMGIAISNSEVGCGSLKIEPLIYRLVCSNGMIVADAGIRKYHVGRRDEDSYDMFRSNTRAADDRAFWMKVRDIMDATVNKEAFNKILQDLKESKRKVFNEPIKEVEVIANKYRMTDGEHDSVINHLVKGGDMSTYGIVQAITRTSQDIHDYDRATEFERIGGEFLASNLN